MLTISVVTVVYNDKDLLEKTIQSVLSQTYENIEYIIIDGRSTDGTVDIIKKYQDQIDHWISAPDKGLYDAMNKGADLATGDFINFLNAGDIYEDIQVLEHIVEAMNDRDSVYFSRANILSKNVCWLYPDTKVEDHQKWIRSNLPNHQSMFFPRAFYKRYTYDLRLRIGADDDYKLSAIKHHTVRFVDVQSVKFERGGISSDHANFNYFKQRLKEGFIRNFKHKRWIRLLIDPFKSTFLYLIHSIFGEEIFLKCIKLIVRLKSRP